MKTININPINKFHNQISIFFVLISTLVFHNLIAQSNLSYPIVDTKQSLFYDTLNIISQPQAGESFYGQDANYPGYQPSYVDNGDGTISDQITELMWQKSTDINNDGVINVDDKLTYEEALSGADTMSLAGYNDWRLPSIKEMYSLIIFSGVDVSGWEGSTNDLIPFIDTDYFDYNYGDESAGERIIDSQYASSTLYVGTTMNGDETMFGVNFADGRIKGYPTGPMPGQTEGKLFYVQYVRGNTDYGTNQLIDNDNGTITDNATGLMWLKDDNGEAVKWQEALSYAENANIAGFSDWRLPNAKELQSIIDYTRSPQTTNSPAINPIFNCSSIIDEDDNENYPFYWSSTTHANMSASPGGSAAYVCFGEALGFMEQPPGSGNYNLMDVHGAGAQRSDPKFGNPDDYPFGHGPQGDVVRIYNYVRLVRDAAPTAINETSSTHLKVYPNPTNGYLTVDLGKETSITNIYIYNFSGSLVFEKEIKNAQNQVIDIQKLNTGIYFVKIIGPEKVYSKKIIKN